MNSSDSAVFLPAPSRASALLLSSAFPCKSAIVQSKAFSCKSAFVQSRAFSCRSALVQSIAFSCRSALARDDVGRPTAETSGLSHA